MQSKQVSPGIAVREDGKYIAFWCTGCGHAHAWLPINRAEDSWNWDEKTLTLTPSVRHFKHVGDREVTTCHYLIAAGKISYCDDSSAHTLRGLHTMQPFPAAYSLGYELEDEGGKEA